jgi:glycosyltransferase involved in cell wall biosynthesis
MPHKVSVIIPIYNRADLLPRAMSSVLNQTFQDFELIIVDDGSTDNTKQVVEEFQKKDKRIKYIWQENSGGPAKPRNIGIKDSQGEYIAFLDSDDDWLPEKLEKQLEIFEKNRQTNLGFVGCNALIVKEDKIQEYKTPKYKNILPKILEGCFIWSCSSVIIKKLVLDKVGFFDENLKIGDDWDMWIRIIINGYSFDFVDEPLFKYYIHSGNISALKNIKKIAVDYNFLLEKYKKYYEQNPKIYSNRLRYTGASYILAKDLKKGREYFKKSIKINPLNFKSYSRFLFSLLGSNFYYKLIQIKKFIFNKI